MLPQSRSPYVHHFIRELVQEGDVNPKWIGTSGNIVDVLTKALLRPAFQRLVDMMGSVGAEGSEDGASGGVAQATGKSDVQDSRGVLFLRGSDSSNHSSVSRICIDPS